LEIQVKKERIARAALGDGEGAQPMMSMPTAEEQRNDRTQALYAIFGADLNEEPYRQFRATMAMEDEADAEDEDDQLLNFSLFDGEVAVVRPPPPPRAVERRQSVVVLDNISDDILDENLFDDVIVVRPKKKKPTLKKKQRPKMQMRNTSNVPVFISDGEEEGSEVVEVQIIGDETFVPALYMLEVETLVDMDIPRELARKFILLAKGNVGEARNMYMASQSGSPAGFGTFSGFSANEPMEIPTPTAPIAPTRQTSNSFKFGDSIDLTVEDDDEGAIIFLD